VAAHQGEGRGGPARVGVQRRRRRAGERAVGRRDRGQARRLTEGSGEGRRGHGRREGESGREEGCAVEVVGRCLLAGVREGRCERPAPARALAAERSPAKNEPAAGPSLPEGAKPARLPETFAPQLATLVSEAPKDGGWSYEIKFDGYRLLARVDGEDVRLYTRNGNDWSDRMPGLVQAVRSLGVGSGWLDGEIVVPGEHGAPDFNLLQNAFDSTRTESILYYLFDVPYWAGHDLRGVPLAERRALLAKLIDSAPFGRIRFSEDFQSSPSELLNNACRMKLEGVIGKRVDSPYVSKRSPAWIKLKCTQRQEFVVGGWTDPKGSRTGIGSLLLGIHDEAGDLRYAGAVGSGFDQQSLAAVKKALSAIGTDKAPFANKPREVKGHWVEPKLVAEVSFGEWTPDGRVRHSVFHGLRDDKPPASITREAPAPAERVEAAAEAQAAVATRARWRRRRRRRRRKRRRPQWKRGQRPRAQRQRRRPRSQPRPRQHPRRSAAARAPVSKASASATRAASSMHRRVRPSSTSSTTTSRWRVSSCRTSSRGRYRWCARRPGWPASSSSSATPRRCASRS
jgi:DNA ligase D-like protein (predicted ligase)